MKIKNLLKEKLIPQEVGYLNFLIFNFTHFKLFHVANVDILSFLEEKKVASSQGFYSFLQIKYN